jgi:mannose-6-phosphate isomerase-like protein (cupin superfamily)
MNHIFEPRGYFTVADGTDVSPFLNATDTKQHELPWGSLGDMSIAAGRIPPKMHSWIHVHPVFAQVTYLLSGALTVRQQERSAPEPYDLSMRPGQAIVTRPGTLFQLRNDGDVPAEVLYIGSPSYVFEMTDGQVKYADATLVAQTWDAVPPPADAATLAAAAYEAMASREESKRRLARVAGIAPKAVAADALVPLKPHYDYLAPDGSEIRLLAAGDHGGFAHCVLPAGHASAAVRHRTVEELWYILEGEGQIARERAGEPPRVDAIRAGDSFRIPVDTTFQFRATGGGDLKLLIATMPPWPGAQEAVPRPALSIDAAIGSTTPGQHGG